MQICMSPKSFLTPCAPVCTLLIDLSSLFAAFISVELQKPPAIIAWPADLLWQVGVWCGVGPFLFLCLNVNQENVTVEVRRPKILPMETVR